jgi:hypothetical protein
MDGVNLILQGFLSQNHSCMKQLIKLLAILCLTGHVSTIQAQYTIPVTGGNATGSGGTVSYTIGQVNYHTLEGTTGTVAEGIQQPYEISVVTAVENTEGIKLEYRVYPNPTSGLLKLIISPIEKDNFRYKLFDINSILLQDQKIESEETDILMDGYSSGAYFLKIIINNRDVKVFKIIKN